MTAQSYVVLSRAEEKAVDGVEVSGWERRQDESRSRKM